VRRYPIAPVLLYAIWLRQRPVFYQPCEPSRYFSIRNILRIVSISGSR
jgi:hypothetical protein